MTLVDTGPLVALLNRNDSDHDLVRATIPRIARRPLLTTWPCLTEAMHFLGRRRGYPAQAGLWEMHFSGQLLIYVPTAADVPRMAALMSTYRDTPMDLADASLVAAAEATTIRKLFTLDSHFRAYRLADGSALACVP